MNKFQQVGGSPCGPRRRLGPKCSSGRVEEGVSSVHEVREEGGCLM